MTLNKRANVLSRILGRFTEFANSFSSSLSVSLISFNFQEKKREFYQWYTKSVSLNLLVSGTLMQSFQCHHEHQGDNNVNVNGAPPHQRVGTSLIAG